MLYGVFIKTNNAYMSTGNLSLFLQFVFSKYENK